MPLTGKKLLINVTLAEVKKRVPSNQMKQFQEFSEKYEHYQREAKRYPEKLPNIDWEFYRLHVPKDFLSKIDQYEVQYHELNKAFEGRHELDFSKYYFEWDQLMEQCKKDIEAFKKESEAKIAEYEKEFQRKSEIKPFEQMSLEEFVTLRSDLADLVPRQNMPIFWPPIPEEQVGYKPPEDDEPKIEPEPNPKPKKEFVSLALRSPSKPPPSEATGTKVAKDQSDTENK